MSLILNRAKANTATTGTGTVTLGSAVVPFQTWANAQPGSSTTRRYSYLIEDGNAWEVGEGIFDESANTLTRNLIASSTGTLLNLSGSATVSSVAKATDSPQVIEKVALSGVNSYTFNDIPQDFADLQLTVFGRSTLASNIDTPAVKVNGLATGIYDVQRQYAQSTTQSGDRFLGQTSWAFLNGIPGTSIADTLVPGHYMMTLIGYSQTAFYKDMHFQGRQPDTAATGAGYQVSGTGCCRTTAAITSLTVFLSGGSNFVAGSYAELRGIP